MINNLKKLAAISCFILSTTKAQTCKTETEIPSTTPDAQFTIHTDGTVTDNKTGLMWSHCSVGQTGTACDDTQANTHNWQAALEQADSSSLATHTDWRLPNVKELFTILEIRCFNPAINANIFPNTLSGSYWSSTPDMVSGNAWSVSHYVEAFRTDQLTTLAVRLVRN